MNVLRKTSAVFVLLLGSLALTPLIARAGPQDARLKEIVAGDHRSEENKARDKYRNPVETLTFDSDFTAFIQPGVDSLLRRQALKTLMNDPRFNVMDRLDVYIDDYSIPDPMPEGWIEKLNQYASLGNHEPGVTPAPEPDPVPEPEPHAGEVVAEAGAEPVPGAAEAPAAEGQQSDTADAGEPAAADGESTP